MKEKCELILLPTENHSTGIIKFGNQLRKHPEGLSNMVYYSMYLYVVSEEKPKKGDWVYDTRDRYVTKNILAFNQFTKKIISTNDKNLILCTDSNHEETCNCNKLSTLSHAFIDEYMKAYNNGNVFTHVMVEYEDYRGYYSLAGVYYENYILKINPDNTINISPIKNSWTKEELPIDEMLNLIGYIDTPVGRKKNHPDVVEQVQLLKKWLEKNL
jgi:hypothetical protein